MDSQGYDQLLQERSQAKELQELREMGSIKAMTPYQHNNEENLFNLTISPSKPVSEQNDVTLSEGFQADLNSRRNRNNKINKEEKQPQNE